MAPPSDVRHTPILVPKRCRIFSLTPDLLQDTRFMKHRTDMQSNQNMRFFTRELYIQFNSPDDAIADQANEKWEKALQDYRSHLDDIRQRMPSQIRKLAELSLHDAEVLGFDKELESLIPFTEPFWHEAWPIWSKAAVLFLRQDNTIRSLIYLLWDDIREYPPKEDWPFSKSRQHWLYDEFDLVDGRRAFIHRILFSDGCIAEIPFASVITSTARLPAMDTREETRQIA
jgi:hypothetical protein